MKTWDAGHLFQLAELDTEGAGQRALLRFVKRDGPGYPGNYGSYPGTTIQEVMRAVIARLLYVDNQIPDARNNAAIKHARSMIWLLEFRAAERHGRLLQATEYEIEKLPVCRYCGHIECTECVRAKPHVPHND